MTSYNYPKLSGLRNTSGADFRKPGSMSAIVNMDIDDEFAVRRRDGYALAASVSGITDSFATLDGERLFVVAGGSIVSCDSALATTVVASVSDTVLAWAEAGDRVYYAGATNAGCIIGRTNRVPLRIGVPATVTVSQAGGSLPAGEYQVAACYRHVDTGISGGATTGSITLTASGGIQITIPSLEGYEGDFYVSEVNGTVPLLRGSDASQFELNDSSYEGVSLDPEQISGVALPVGVSALAFYAARLYAGVYDAASDTSTVYWSGAFYPQCWSLHQDFLTVRGAIKGMLGTEYGVLIGTGDRIYLYTGDDLKELAQFGVPGGRPFVSDRSGMVAIWSNRGLCTFPSRDGQSITERHTDKVSVAPGLSCSAAIVERRGLKQLVVITSGTSSPENSF